MRRFQAPLSQRPEPPFVARVALLLISCVLVVCGPHQPEWYVSRPVTAAEVRGTWTLANQRDDLSRLNEFHGLGPLHIKGKTLVLNPDGTCEVSVEVAGDASGSRSAASGSEGTAIPTDRSTGPLLHSVDGCRWSVGVANVGGRYHEQSVASVDVGITRRGYFRGLSFFIRERDERLRLWARGNASDRVELGR